MFLNDVAGREAIKAAMAMPHPLNKQLMAYIGLFRPRRCSLTWDRVEKLLKELLEPMEAGKLVRNHRTHVVTTEIWQAALEELLARRDTLRLPMKTHGLLFEITAGLADKWAAKQERDKEDALKNRPRRNQPQQSCEEDPNEAWKRTMEKYGRTDLIPKQDQTGGDDHEA
ncbi:MAG: hypothetical protein AB2552_05655 [Candidatus Thiodiazotropha endolucinida]